MSTELAAVAQTSQSVAATAGRLAKVELIAQLLGRLTPAEARIVVSWLSGELTQRQIGVGWAGLRTQVPPADQPSWTVTQVDDQFWAIKDATGPGSQALRRTLLTELLARATAPEQAFLRALLSGGLRQGALAGLMADAIARAYAVPVADVRRAAMLTGDLAATAELALTAGTGGLTSVSLQVGRPVGPMLAQTATGVGQALERLGEPMVLQVKLDGARVQAHKSGAHIAVFTRSLDDITARMPEVVAAVAALPARDLVLDGEVITHRPDGRPQPFQLTAARVGRRRDGVAVAADGAPAYAPAELSAYWFDLLHRDGIDLLGEPTTRRLAALEELVPAGQRVGQLITGQLAEAERFLADSLAAGHEGVMAKSAAAPYEAGRRGAAWLKIKPVHTLDLVVLAVEWGSGRRRGWLSNLHLGARGPDGFVMLGKTFKGMTDEMLRWQTARFTELADGATDGWVVRVRPEQVVEIAFDGVQRSSRYPGGVALRFARVLRYRPDKTAAEADTIETVRAFLP